ncbi:hypothetical protein E2C01_002001 [Portunus trituberculatus]|uniref:Uncharacterized protein n=1 Tax=Portunus trituberculatus TaxID=210409 RepID=A0A5B7CJ79_PORTR|nr:hypothetical protein [Portunus trituberculatus]
MMELQDVRDENLPSFLVYRPSRISNGLRLMPLRVLGAGVLGILCASIVFVIANLIIFAAHPSPETQTPDAEIFIDLDLDGEEQIYLDLDLENPIELEELYDQDDLTTPPFIPTPQFMNQEMPNTPSTPQDPTPPVLVFYRPAKTPSRLPKPANGTHLSSSLPDPHPSQAPPRDIPPVTTDCTDSSPCPPALPPYHTPFVTLFTKIKSRFVAITPSITNRFPTSTTPTTTTATNYTTVPSITTTSTPTTATTTVTSSIAVTSAPFVHIIVASPLNIEPTLDLPTEAQTPEKEPVSCGYSRGKVIMYVLLAILIFLLLVVVYEMVKLCKY